jgi:hypothetical protein
LLRWAALVLILAGWLCAANVLTAQEMFGTTGAPLGGLEPWDEPARPSPRDLGIENRVQEMLKHHVESLHKANAAVRDAASQGWNVAADAALQRRQTVCEDILAVIGIIKRHNSEIQKWQLGASKTRYILGPDLFSSALVSSSQPTAPSSGRGPTGSDGAAPSSDRDSAGSEGAATAAQKAPGSDDSAAAHSAPIWPHLASPWLPYEAAVEFNFEERQILERLGLSPTTWEADQELALCALLTLLRQVKLDASGILMLQEDLLAFAKSTGSQYVEKYEMGKLRTDANQTALALEFSLGHRDVCRLSDEDNRLEHSLALGSYTYLAVRPDATAKRVQAVSAPMAKAFLGKTICPPQPGEAARSYAEKGRLFVVLSSELQTRVKSALEGSPVSADVALYSPFLWALAHSVPCLSPFQADVRTDGSVRLTQGRAAPDEDGAADVWSAEEALNRLLAGKGSKAQQDLFLLQADLVRDGGDVWQWKPRAAGFRGYLNQRQKATPASGGK